MASIFSDRADKAWGRVHDRSRDDPDDAQDGSGARDSSTNDNSVIDSDNQWNDNPPIQPL